MFTPQRLFTLAALLALANAQSTFSTVPVIDGNTVVIGVTTDPLGNTVATVIGTVSNPAATNPVSTPGLTTPVPGTASTPVATSTTPITTSSTPRVVGQPGPTGETGPTVYTYMTTDANGNPTQVVDTYTPSYGFATTSASAARSGTIIPYDQYTSMYGGGSGGSGSGLGNSAARQSAALGLGAAAAICVLGGFSLLL